MAIDDTLELVSSRDSRLRTVIPQYVWDDIEQCLNLQRISQEMIQFLRWHISSHGLAANQVDIGVRMFVLTDLVSRDMGLTVQLPLVYVNPSIVWRQGEDRGIERCGSFPGITIEVTRPERIQVQAQTIYGGPFFKQCLRDEAARSACQAIDLLNGKTIMDHSCFGEVGRPGVGRGGPWGGRARFSDEVQPYSNRGDEE